MTVPDDPPALARACAAAMWESDPATRGLGVRIADIGPGEARLELTIRPDMANGHGMCHGGFVFMLADCAFAYACNSRNQRMVAGQASIAFLAPAQVGETLTAHAREVHLRGRGGVYDVTVRNAAGESVAEFRGHCRAISGPVLPA